VLHFLTVELDFSNPSDSEYDWEKIAVLRYHTDEPELSDL